VDLEVERLIERFPENDEADDPLAELGTEAPERTYDRLIVGLSQGDIVKGLEIMEKVTMTQALNWLLIRMNNG
jgi:hypothetical protein